MKIFNLAIEKGKRYLSDNNIISFYFVATEFIFKKEDIVSGNYRFEFKNNDKVFFEQILKIDVENRRVFIESSHEDPLIESENYFFICGQLTQDLIKAEYESIECSFYKDNQLIRKQEISSNELIQLFSLEVWNSYIHKNILITNKNCRVRVHLGKSDTSYYEEEFYLEKNEIFDFSKYLNTHEYVAVQCSYEENMDIEEKHVLKGIKGIWNSQYYYNNELYIPMIPFSLDYAHITKEKWIDIQSIKDLINYYNNNPNDVSKIFEMNEEFLIPYYKKYKTSAIGKIYSSLNSKKFHIESNFCEECDKKSECMQLVPSGMSELVFKKNLMVESFKNCSINKLIKKD